MEKGDEKESELEESVKDKDDPILEKRKSKVWEDASSEYRIHLNVTRCDVPQMMPCRMTSELLLRNRYIEECSISGVVGEDSTCISDSSETPKLPMKTTKGRGRSRWRKSMKIAREKSGDSCRVSISCPDVVSTPYYPLLRLVVGAGHRPWLKV